MDRRKLLQGGLASFLTFTSIGALNGTLAGCAPAAPGPLPAGATGEVVRIAPDRVRVSWQGVDGPVRLLKSDSPAATASAATEMAAAASSPMELSAPPAPRPYFILQTATGARMELAERVLPLEGGRNFRDLGGYRAEDGRTVRWGHLYRSGVMAELTGGDLAYLRSLGIARVCDFRSDEEISREPSKASGIEGLDYVTFAYEMDMGSSLGPLLQAQTRDEAVKAFADSYLAMATMLKPHFTDLFERLVSSTAPLAMNCSAGKDRTGVAAALILGALGVGRDTIIADYALSENIVPPDKYLDAIRSDDGGMSMPPEQRAMFARIPEPVLRVLFGTDADVMRLTLDRIDAEHGGLATFAATNFGLDAARAERLRASYLV